MMGKSLKVKLQFPTKLINLPNITTRYIVIFGGRGSSKSWSVAQTLILKALQSNILILCTREIQNTIKDSVHRLLSDTIVRLNLSRYFEVVKDEIRCVNGSKFIFKGIHHNIDEIKSMEGVKYCWIEEGQSLSESSFDIIDPTIRSAGSQIYITLNPKKEDAPIYKNFILSEHPDSTVIKINYNDNPFFTSELNSIMQYCKQHDYDKYLHIWEGNPLRISEACIFKDHFEVKSFDTKADASFLFGADWGYASDPTVLTRCYIDDNCLFIDYEAYGNGIEITEIPALFNTVPSCKQFPIRGDSARPEIISYLRSLGYPIVSCKKGKNSVEAGIDYIRKFRKIYIHSRCINTAFEFANYSYKIDTFTNKVLPIIIDKHNHCTDALRYSLEGRYSFEFTEIMQDNNLVDFDFNPFSAAIAAQVENSSRAFNF